MKDRLDRNGALESRSDENAEDKGWSEREGDRWLERRRDGQKEMVKKGGMRKRKILLRERGRDGWIERMKR